MGVAQHAGQRVRAREPRPCARGRLDRDERGDDLRRQHGRARQRRRAARALHAHGALPAAGRQPAARLRHRRPRRRRDRPRGRIAGRHAARALPHLAGAVLARALHGADRAARGAARDGRPRRGADPVHARPAGLGDGRRARLGRRARGHRAPGDARRGAARPARLRRPGGPAAARPVRQPLARARRPSAARRPRPGGRAGVPPREPAGDAPFTGAELVLPAR